MKEGYRIPSLLWKEGTKRGYRVQNSVFEGNICGLCKLQKHQVWLCNLVKHVLVITFVQACLNLDLPSWGNKLNVTKRADNLLWENHEVFKWHFFLIYWLEEQNWDFTLLLCTAFGSRTVCWRIHRAKTLPPLFSDLTEFYIKFKNWIHSWGRIKSHTHDKVSISDPTPLATTSNRHQIYKLSLLQKKGFPSTRNHWAQCQRQVYASLYPLTY